MATLLSLLAVTIVVSLKAVGIILVIAMLVTPGCVAYLLSDRFGVPDMARRVQASGRTGWYLRVLGTGSVSAGDAVLLAHRPHPGWPLARIAALIDQRVCEPSALRELLALPLPPSWRRLFERRLTQGLAEDWSARLEGQAPQ